MQYLQGRLKVGVVHWRERRPRRRLLHRQQRAQGSWPGCSSPTDTHFGMSQAILPATLTGVFGYGQVSIGVNYATSSAAASTSSPAWAPSACVPPGGRRRVRRGRGFPYVVGACGIYVARRDPRRAGQRFGVGEPQPARPAAHLLRGHLRPRGCVAWVLCARSKSPPASTAAASTCHEDEAEQWRTNAAMSAGHLRGRRARRQHVRRPAVGRAPGRRRLQPVPRPRGPAPPQVAGRSTAARPSRRSRTGAQLTKLVARRARPEWEALAQRASRAAGGAPDPATEPVDPWPPSSAGLTERGGAALRRPRQASLNVRLARGPRVHRPGGEGRRALPLRAPRRPRRTAASSPSPSTCRSGPGTSSSPTRRRAVTQAGDRRVLVLWNRNPYARRSSCSARPPGRPVPAVNPKPVAYDMDSGPRRSAARDAAPGLPRHRYWDTDGLPDQPRGRGDASRARQRHHLLVPGRVAGHARPGGRLVRAAARPRPCVASRRWPPTTCRCRRTLAAGLVVTWRKVTRNVENHQLPDTTQTNYVYRADDPRGPRGPLEPRRQAGRPRSPADPQDPTTPT